MRCLPVASAMRLENGIKRRRDEDVFPPATGDGEAGMVQRWQTSGDVDLRGSGMMSMTAMPSMIGPVCVASAIYTHAHIQ